MRLISIHLFQQSLWDLFQPSVLDNLQTLAIVNLALLSKNTVNPDVVYCPKIGADETNPRFKERRFLSGRGGTVLRSFYRETNLPEEQIPPEKCGRSLSNTFKIKYSNSYKAFYTLSCLLNRFFFSWCDNETSTSEGDQHHKRSLSYPFFSFDQVR